jgi:hypothetical protein
LARIFSRWRSTDVKEIGDLLARVRLGDELDDLLLGGAGTPHRGHGVSSGG